MNSSVEMDSSGGGKCVAACVSGAAGGNALKDNVRHDADFTRDESGMGFWLCDSHLQGQVVEGLIQWK